MKYVIDKSTGKVIRKPEKMRAEPIDVLPIPPELQNFISMIEEMRREVYRG